MKSSQRKRTIEDFEMIGILGEGNYGKVYAAVEKSNRKPYAIKILDKYHVMKVNSQYLFL